MATIDTLAQQEQLHFQVIQAAINSLYLNLNSSNNSQTANLTSLINNQTNNLGGQVYTQANRVITALQGQAVTLENQTLNTVRGLFTAEGQKLDVIQHNTLVEIDKALALELADNQKHSDDILKLISYSTDKLYTLDAQVGAEIKALQLQIEGNLNREIQAVTTHAQEDANRLLAPINDLLLKASAKLATDLNTNIKDLLNTSGFGGTGEPAWLSDLMQKLYTNGQSSSPAASDTFFTGLIRLLLGNPSADVANTIDTLDISGNIQKQIDKLLAIADNALHGKYNTLDDLNKDLHNIGVDSPVLGAVLQLPFVVANIGAVFNAFGLPVTTKIEQLLIASYSLKQLNENDLLTAFIRNNLSPEDVHKNLDNIGHSSDDSNILMKNALPRYTIQELFRLGYLGKMNGDDIKKYMRTLGWNEQDTIEHGYLNQPRPGIQDLIAFAVKEVYSPEIYTKFGQYQDFPKEFAAQAKLLGLDETFAQQYWAAHWALPGAQQGFDLFHRGIITHDDLVALLKALDVMPFWRDKLVQLSYNIVARVDTRRLYAYGIWDTQKVYQNYLAEGYSPNDARDLTSFTVKYDAEQDNKHKTYLQKKAHDVYIKSFNYGLIDQNTAANKIVALGYKQNDVDLELSLEKYESYVDAHKPKKENHVAKITSLALDGYRKKAISRQDLLASLTANGYSLPDANNEADFMDKESAIAFKEGVVKEIQKLYFESLLDDNSTLTKLIQLGFANSEALNIISELQILKSLDDKKPTPAQFKTMFENGIITQTEYEIELANMGYNAKYIPNIIALSVGT